MVCGRFGQNWVPIIFDSVVGCWIGVNFFMVCDLVGNVLVAHGDIIGDQL